MADSTGQPLDCTVLAYSEADHLQFRNRWGYPRFRKAEQVAKGSFVIQKLARGEYRVRAACEGHAHETKRISFGSGMRRIAFTVGKGYLLAGVVHARCGRSHPVFDVDGERWLPGGGGFGGGPLSGLIHMPYELPGITSGTHEIKMLASGYVSMAKTVTISGDTTGVDFWPVCETGAVK